jgi:hypothetical protein
LKTRALRNSKSVAATNIVAFCDKKNITNSPNSLNFPTFLLETLKSDRPSGLL